VPLAGMTSTMGSPSAGVYPAGWSSTAANTAARMTEMKVKNAERVATLDSVLNVRGSEKIQEMIATMNEKTTVHTAPLDIVFKYSAPTTQCRPWMKVLFRRNMTAVAHHAILESQNRY
jgi:hypothetical protein